MGATCKTKSCREVFLKNGKAENVNHSGVKYWQRTKGIAGAAADAGLRLIGPN